MTTVILNSREIDLDAATALMDDEIRESLHGNFEDGEEQAFLNAYVVAHAAKFDGEQFTA